MSAQVDVRGRGEVRLPFGDGILTGRGTFQKFFEQGELKSYIEAQLGTEPVPAALGVFYVFKDEGLRQQFLANRYHRRAAAPRQRISEQRFEQHRDVLEPLMSVVDAACARSGVGKLLPDDLYVHRDCLDRLEPILRVYEGCGRAYLGEVEGANLVKIHRRSGKLSYLCYPDFDRDPHPALLRSVRLSLRSRQLDCTDYAHSANPPVLHRKETFLHAGHPLYAKFARLTRQEERHGLLEETASIGTRAGWEARLREKGFGLRGHRLVRVDGKA